MKIKVIKIGGKLIENNTILASLCDHLSTLGEAFVLVHGGGVMGSHLAEQLGEQGNLIRNITLFSVLVYELVGPMMTKWALTKAGDIKPKPTTKRGEV